jgi:hypothetical protein
MFITQNNTRMSLKSKNAQVLIIYRWSAVTRGAAIYGIEKTQHSNAIKTKSCPSNYGIAINEDYQTSWIRLEDLDLDDVLDKRTSKQQLSWLLKRGDLILLSKPYKNKETAIFSFTDDDPRMFEIPVYEYTDDDDWLPTHVEGREGGEFPCIVKIKHILMTIDLVPVTTLEIDLNKYDIQKFPSRKHKKGVYRIAVFNVTMELKNGALTLEVFWKGQSVCQYAHKNPMNTSQIPPSYQTRLPSR